MIKTMDSTYDSALNDPVNTTDIFIKLKEKDALLVKIDKKDYYNITCDDLIKKINKTFFKIDNFLIEDFFSLWMVSPLLEIQLKKNYFPFNLLASWDELIKNFASNDLLKNQEVIKDDVPQLSLQRNIFLNKREELNINNSIVLKLFYEEAKEKVLNGKYLFEDNKNYEILAAIQFVITYNSKLNENIVNLTYLRSTLFELLPKHFYDSFYGLFMSLKRSRNSLESKIMRNINEKFLNLSLNELYIEYLRICHLLLTYGAVFFDGQIEKNISIFSSIYKNYDVKIWVAINYDGIHIIDKKSFKLIAAFSFDQFNWELGISQNMKDNIDALPCLFLEVVSEETTNEKKLLQIFSKQSKLMDNLLKQFDSNIKDLSDKVDSIMLNCSVSSCNSLNIGKLACATFNNKGECIKKKRSFKLVR